jgi:hypothetical protein
VIESGVVPVDDLYFTLKPGSRNLGQLDQDALVAGRDPFVVLQPDATYLLARLGDAISGRNIHAALYDALRICKNL